MKVVRVILFQCTSQVTVTNLPTDKSQYIYISPVFSKILEKPIYNHIVKYLNDMRKFYFKVSLDFGKIIPCHIL